MLVIRFVSPSDMGLGLLLLLSAMVAFLVGRLLRFRSPNPSLPPYPTRPLPFLGHLLTVKRDFRPQFKKWWKQCGDIFSLDMAGSLLVVLNGLDLLKEALINQADDFQDRPLLFLDTATGYPGKGVAFSSGDEWKEHRSVTMTILRSLGVGKNIMAKKIQKEVDIFVKHLSDLQGKPIDILPQTTISFANIISSILTAQTSSFEYNEFKELMAKLQLAISNLGNGNPLNFLPWLKYLPGDFFEAKRITTNFKDVVNKLNACIDKENAADVSIEDADNFITAYLGEMNRRTEANKQTYMDKETLTKTVLELFIAGSDTSTVTIYWCVLYLINYPDVQEKIYSEIMSVVGKDRTPTIDDKPKLNYLQATILEIQRIVSLAALGLARVCLTDVTLRGYILPKGTLIVPNLDSVHHDEDIWGPDVMTFNPDRFLGNEGLVTNQEKIIPFGLGRRMCLGENLAKMEVFLFLSSMVQKLRFLPPDPMAPPPTNYVCRLVIAPQPYQVIVLERK